MNNTVKYRCFYDNQMCAVSNINFYLDDNDAPQIQEVTLISLDGEYTWYEELSSPEFQFMQYTGLKDKKGKEIFEGDIVFDGELYGAIKFVKDSFVIDFGARSGITSLSYYLDIIFVAGNIFENPELMEK